MRVSGSEYTSEGQIQRKLPDYFSFLQLFPVPPHSTAEQLAQQIALDMEIYMYKINPRFFHSALIKWQLMKKR